MNPREAMTIEFKRHLIDRLHADVDDRIYRTRNELSERFDLDRSGQGILESALRQLAAEAIDKTAELFQELEGEHER